MALWGTNILDEEYVVYALDEFNSGNQVDAYGRPRTYGVDVVYEFLRRSPTNDRECLLRAAEGPSETASWHSTDAVAGRACDWSLKTTAGIPPRSLLGSALAIARSGISGGPAGQHFSLIPRLQRIG